MSGRAAALSLLALAAAPLIAAKPGPEADPARAAYRADGVRICSGSIGGVSGLTSDDRAAICGCALDRLMQGRDIAVLPRVAFGAFRGTMEPQLLACTAELRPDHVNDVARGGIGAPRSDIAPVAGPATPDKPARDSPPPADAPRRNDRDFWAWLGSLGVLAWFDALSVWSWIAIGLLVFGLLALAVRRRDTRADLTGPPAAWRRGVPPPPRRPELPR